MSTRQLHREAIRRRIDRLLAILMAKVVVIIVAAGRSRRFGRDKLWLKLGKLPVITHTLAAFERCPTIDGIILVINPRNHRRFAPLKAHSRKLIAMVAGGAERRDSVWNGLQALPAGTGIVLIHDAARPCVSARLISQTVAAARKHGAAIAAAPLTDTVKEVKWSRAKTMNPRIAKTLDRSLLWAAQTPQTFRTDLIRRAYAKVMARKTMVTDDAATVELLGKPVHVVPSDAANLKITRPADLLIARLRLQRK